MGGAKRTRERTSRKASLDPSKGASGLPSRGFLVQAHQSNDTREGVDCCARRSGVQNPFLREASFVRSSSKFHLGLETMTKRDFPFPNKATQN